jgi:tight adherence protein B
VAVLAAAGAMRLALVFLDRREDQRREAFVAQLPELARLLSNATSAGLALRSAIRMAADDLAAPAGPEMAYVSNRLDLGTPMIQALGELHDRLPSRELSLLTRTLIIQTRAGGAVVTALREMSETLEARKDLRREVRTLLAGPVFTSWVVVFLGIGAVLMLNLVAPGTLHRLTSTLIGQAALVVAGVVYALGFLMIRRTTRIEI